MISTILETYTPRQRLLIKYFALFVFFLLFWGGFFLLTQALTSGFHFTDDHEIPRIWADIQRTDVFSTIGNWLERDFLIRFRPIFYVHRIVLVGIFGTNFVLFAVYNLLLAVASSWLIASALIRLGLGRIKSILVTLLVLVGIQTEIWWRLGTNETLATVLFSLGLFLLVFSYKEKYRRATWYFSSLIVFILAALTKESFIVMLPAVAFINFWLAQIRLKLNIWQAFKSTFLYSAVLGIVCLVSVWIIFSFIGTSNIGYAGVDTGSLTLRRLLGTVKEFFRPEYMRTLPLLLGIAFLAELLRIVYQAGKIQVTSFKDFILKVIRPRVWIYTGILFVLIILPQAVLHARSGVYPRYLVPGIFAFGLLVIIPWHVVEKRLPFFSAKQTVSALILVVVLFGLGITGKEMYLNAKAFAQQGISTNESIGTLVQNSEPTDYVAIVGEPANNFEWSYSLYHYLTIKEGYSNIVIVPVLLENTLENEFGKGLSEAFLKQFPNANTLDQMEDPDSLKSLFVFEPIESEFLARNSSWFEKENYSRYANNWFVVYTRN